MTQQLKIERFNKDLPLIADLRALIKEKYADLFYAVIVHGSVATNEVVPYSDFDGLLIIKDEFANSNRLQRFKLDSTKLILKFDPLQHHGWFQIKESDLNNYPQYYLPYEILEHSKVIFSRKDDLLLNIKFDESKIDYKKSLSQLITGIQQQLDGDVSKMRMYEFKSYLSKIMLLPSMYYSAKYRKGIFKKDSFELVKPLVSENAWHCIEVSSDIRQNWSYKISVFQKRIMTLPNRIFRRLTKRYISPNIPQEFSNKIDSKFYKSLEELIDKINKDIFVA
ncbi:nucleotidyltransferase domain-containing protein [Winogradskyella aquimaris]|uniref:Nucleotidyltransferase domain-containing protein n=1 Tax=Winogradskyella aquimaris TaxID=864074 RepID=A0ABU5END8_9FLAO|nr:nucleotidyltransferase domain-containing protein [Winogradskyella aquimaris]MDY2587088.1 nucleotidyltransferase domain-containing protein [Winogradskyella aquimaris]